MVAQSLQSLSEITTRRRTAVASLSVMGQSPTEIARNLKAQGIVNPRTKKPFSRTTVQSDLRLLERKPQVEMINGKRVFRRPMAETIGTWTMTKPMFQSRYLYNVDTSWKDLAFWDALRRGMAPGYEVGGMFCTPIAQTIASYTLGTGMSASLIDSAVPASAVNGRRSIHQDGKPTQALRAAKKTSLNVLPPRPQQNVGSDPLAYTNAQLSLMMKRMQGFFQSVVVDQYCLGNQYVACNPDCTFSVLSPDTVTVEYSASDYRRPVRYIVRTKMEKATVEDVYTAEKRVITVKYNDGTRKDYEYENLIGRIPIVHFPCDRSANEISGRPIYEAALPVMRQYDDLLLNIIEGVKLLGNPFPAFVGLDNVNETKENNSKAVTYTDEDGNEQTEWVTLFDRNRGLYVGKGGDVKMVSTPVGFTKDSLDTLRQLFLLLLNHTRIPEYVWGGAINSSKASAEVQQPPFIKYVQFRRLQLEGEGADPALGIAARGGFLELIDIWLRMYKLLNPAIVVGPVRIEWPEIDITDSQIRYMWGSFLNSTNQLSTLDTLKLTGFFDDAPAVAQRATGKTVRPPRYDDYDAKLNRARLEAAQYEEAPHDGDEPPMSTDWITPFSDQPENDNQDMYSIAGPLYWQSMLGGGH